LKSEIKFQKLYPIKTKYQIKQGLFVKMNP